MSGKVYLDDHGNPVSAGAAKVYLDDNGEPVKPKAETVPHAQLRGFKEGAAQGASDLYEGTKEGLSGVAQMVLHPVDTAKAFGGGLAAAAEAVPDVVRNLANPDARAATVKGFVKGGAEGAAGVDGNATFSKKVGQFIGGTVIPAVATGGAARGLKALRAGAAPMLAIETAGEAGSGPRVTQVKSSGQPIKLKAIEGTPVASEARVPYVAAEAAADAAPEAAPKPSPNANGRLVKGGARASEPPVRNVNQAVSQAIEELAQPAAEPAFQQKAARRAPRVTKNAYQPVKVSDQPETWKPFVDVDSPAAAPHPAEVTPNRNLPGIITKRTPKPGAVATAREALGAKEAGNIFGMSPEEVRATAPGPSRKPLKVRMAEMDSDYNRLINDERGAIDPAVLRTLGLAVGGGLAGSLASDDHPLAGGLAGALGGAALANPLKTLKGVQELRMTGMLSGAALPKSLAGNVGAVATAAAENGSLAPIREALRVPTNIKNFASGFANGTHPNTGPIGKLNVFGRAMSGADEATRAALQRAGVSADEAHRLLLTKPEPLGRGTLAKAAASPVGQAIMPFQKIPFNTVAEGINSINELAPGSGSSNVRKALTVGAGVAGAAAGDETDNPLVLGLLAALAGPRALPFGVGAALTGGPKVLERIGTGLPDASVKDVVDPLRPINKPALLRLLQQLQGG